MKMGRPEFTHKKREMTTMTSIKNCNDAVLAHRCDIESSDLIMQIR
jgi:hypothetical protein